MFLVVERTHTHQLMFKPIYLVPGNLYRLERIPPLPPQRPHRPYSPRRKQQLPYYWLAASHRSYQKHDLQGEGRRAMTKMAYLIMAVLGIAPLGVTARLGTTMEIARCADLPPTITSDTTLHFTNSKVILFNTCGPPYCLGQSTWNLGSGGGQRWQHLSCNTCVASPENEYSYELAQTDTHEDYRLRAAREIRDFTEKK